MKTTSNRKTGQNTLQLIRLFFESNPLQSFFIIGGLVLSGVAEGLGVGVCLPLLTLLTRGDMVRDNAWINFINRIMSVVHLQPTVGLFLFFIIVSFLLKALLRFIMLRSLATVGTQTAEMLRTRFVGSILKARWEYFLDQGSGKLASAITAEPDQAAESFVMSGKLLASLFQVAIYLALAFAVSWKVSLFALFVGGVCMAILNHFVQSMRQASLKLVSTFRSAADKMVQAVQGIKPLKAMATEDLLEPVMASEVKRLRQFRFRAEMSRIHLDVLLEPIQMVTVAVGFYFALKFLHVRFEVLSIGLLILFRLLDHIGKVQIYYQSLARAESVYWSLQNLQEDAEAQCENLPGGIEPVMERHLSLKDVTLHRGDKKVLDSISMRLAPGRMIMLNGVSGAGKTTVADLIVGLIQPDEGEILLDDIPLTDINLRAWRSMIGYIPQELFLFHASILTNVTLDDPELSEQDAIMALQASEAWDFVAQLSEGIHTVVGEQGAKLSGGQRQRIAIARALVRRPRLLILDEATSGLDSVTEELLLETLRKLASSLTVFVISHRSCFSRGSDLIYGLDEGKIQVLFGHE